MTLFYILAAVVTAVVAAALAWPLLRPRPLHDPSQQRLNAAVYREQLALLEKDLAEGSLTQSEYQIARDELAARLLEDEKLSDNAEPAAATAGLRTRSRSALAVALVVPLAAAGMYAKFGAPTAVDAVQAAHTQQQDIVKMVEALADRLKANPDNPKGWSMLARSYKALGRMQEAEEAFGRIGPTLDQDADALLAYADLIASRTDSLEGKPLELISKALKATPDHPMGLMLLGTAAYRKADYKGAIVQWEKVLAQLDPGSQDAQQVLADIDDARAKAGLPPAARSAAQAAGPAAGGGAAPNPQEMVERLAARLKANPDDPAGWARLGRAYKVLGKMAESADAYGKAGKLVDTDPDMLTDYADALATSAGGKLEGKPLSMIKRALELNPQHGMALMLAGTAAYRSGDFKGAVTQWEKLKPLFPPGSKDSEWVDRSIADAKSKLK